MIKGGEKVYFLLTFIQQYFQTMRIYTCSNSLRNVYGTWTTWEKMNFDVMSNILHSDLFHQIIIAFSAEIRLCLLSGLTSSKYCSSLHWLEVIKFWFFLVYRYNATKGKKAFEKIQCNFAWHFYGDINWLNRIYILIKLKE